MCWVPWVHHDPHRDRRSGLNRILTRQLRRLGLNPDQVPDDLKTWQRLIRQIASTYDESDRGRYLLEQSMEVSSREMHDLNREIEELSAIRVERSEQHYRHLFSQLPVAAWEEDFRRVVAAFDELRRNGVSDIGVYFDENPDALIGLVAQVEVVDFNAAVFDLIGTCNREDLLGPINPMALDPDSLASWRNEFELIWNGEGHVTSEFTGQRLDGSRFPAVLHWTASRIRGVYEYSRVMVVVIDITDRIAAEERMRQLVKSKDEFLATVSHELRTPLTSVLGYAEVLRGSDVTAAESKAMVATIADQATDLANIVEDLLVGARGDLGQLDVDASPFDVLDLLSGVLHSASNVKFEPSASKGVVAVGDAGRVRQILRNLLSNAERYGGKSRSVAVAVTGGMVSIAVCDGGPPLPPDVSERIFDRYYRGQAGSGRPGSVGIGLTISRELARMMGGDLVYRHDGKWSRFELSLPTSVAKLRVAS